ncbi:unnamed protein product [Parajaminaea phylloscopi]
MRPSLRLLSTAQTPRSKAVGFIGLGAMGKEMARNLLTKTFAQDPEASFVVCDVEPNAVTRFITAHTALYPNRRIVPSTSPSSVARLCSTVVTMLPSSPQVKEVYLGEGGILQGLQDATQDAGSLCIDCTTCDRQTGVDVAAVVGEQAPPSQMIDAPVSGGVAGASAGTLTFLVGSDSPSVFAQAEPRLLNMGARAIHCGPNGTGLTAKIANNLVLGATMLATAEAMALAVKGGLSAQMMAHVLNTSTGKSWSSECNNPAPGALRGSKFSPPAERDWEGGFAARLQAKDLKLALQAAEQVGLPIPMAMLASRVYDALEKREEYRNKDFSVAFKALMESAEILQSEKEAAKASS